MCISARRTEVIGMRGEPALNWNGLETETNKNKSSSCDVFVTYDDVRCF